MRGHCAATRDSAQHRATEAMNQHQRAALRANLPKTGGMAHNVAGLIGWSVHVLSAFNVAGVWWRIMVLRGLSWSASSFCFGPWRFAVMRGLRVRRSFRGAAIPKFDSRALVDVQQRNALGGCVRVLRRNNRLFALPGPVRAAPPLPPAAAQGVALLLRWCNLGWFGLAWQTGRRCRKR